MVKRLFVALTLLCCALIGPQTSLAQTVIENPALKPKPAAESDTPAEAAQLKATDTEPQESANEPAVAEPVVGSETLLPASTKAWISVRDADELEQKFNQTQFGLLLQKDTLKPFAEHIKGRVKEWIDDQNVRLNLNIDDLQGVHSGEICFAGILPEDNAGEPIVGNHGLVFLMDVSNTKDRARELQTQINAELVERGAKQIQGKINGIDYTKSVIDKPKVFRKKRFNFQAIVGNWMLVSNNEAVFRTMIQNLSAPEKLESFQTLGGTDAFKSVMEKSAFEKHQDQIRWYVDPFGYAQLAQQIRDDEALAKVPRDDWSKKLKENGFGALKGIGGNICIATGEHEILHRTFTYARKNAEQPEKVFDLLDFQINSGQPMNVPRWVPNESSSVIIGNWNTKKALDGVGHFYDSVVGESEGDFERMLVDLKQDPNLQLDVRRMVSLLDDRFVMISATEQPIGKESERVVGGVRIKEDPTYVLESIKRSDPNARMIKLGDADVVEIDSTVEPESDIGDLPTFEIDDDFAEEEEQEEEEPRFQLFEKRYFVITKAGEELYLLVANDKNYLRRVIEQDDSQLEQADDYQQVSQALSNLVSLGEVNWRTFGRLDIAMQTNYELLRRGEMGDSQTMLARILNQIAAERRAEQARLEGKDFDRDTVREQQLDGTTLPSDYAQEIAPFLGPTGSVVETMDDGWRITGCLLRKKELVAVVQKVDEVEKDEDTPDKR